MRTEQVVFCYEGDPEEFGGILIDDKYIICGCCGGVTEVDDGITIVKRLSWINISEDIKGE